MIKISERLKSLAEYVYIEDITMDVGCDHAILDIYLVQAGLLNKIYVCDVNPNALQNGIDNIAKYGLENKIIPVLGYGIEKANEYNINSLIISGMGSKNIIDILSSPYLERIYKLILQSNNNHYELRKFLASKNFIIVDEQIIKDGKKTYINIVTLKNYKNPVRYTEKEYEFGPLLILDKNNLEYFYNLKNNLENIHYQSGNDNVKQKIEYLNEIIENLEK